MKIQINQLVTENIDKCTKIICDSILGKRYEYQEERTRNMLQNALKNQEKIYTAHIENNVVGLIWYDKKGSFTIAPYLKLIVINEKFKGLNIGSTLIEFYENQCKESNKHYFLLVSDFNTNAINFYERKGYKKIGTIPSFVKQDVNEIIMIKKITSTVES